jgi:hypothetical protein
MLTMPRAGAAERQWLVPDSISAKAEANYGFLQLLVHIH